MNDTRREMVLYSFYDRTGIQKYLEKQAAKGWLLEKIDALGWRFRRTEPKKVRFNVVYFPGADQYDPEPGEEQLEFQEFCRADGWILAASTAQMQIFYTGKPDPVPIETDPAMEVENIHRSMKKGQILGYWLLLLSAGLQLLSQWIGFRESAVRYLSLNISLFMFAAWIILGLVAVARIAVYYRWYHRAKRMAEQEGVFLPCGNFALAEGIIGLLLIIGMAAMVASLDNKAMIVSIVLALILVAIVIVLVHLFQDKLKREGYDAKTTRTATFVAIVVIVVVVMGGGSRIASGIAGSVDDRDLRDPTGLYLRIEDLLGYDSYVYDRLVLYNQESALLAFQDAMQLTTVVEPELSLSYDIVDVKHEALRELCLAEIMSVPKRLQGSSYAELDPTPWGADAAWQLQGADVPGGWYVLCYGDRIAELLFSWEPTAEQMAIVGEKLG